MDTTTSPEIKTEVTDRREVDQLKAEIDDLHHEIDGARNTIQRLSAELLRLRQRYHVAAEGDL